MLFITEIQKLYEHSASFSGFELIKVRPLRKSYSAILLRNPKHSKDNRRKNSKCKPIEDKHKQIGSILQNRIKVSPIYRNTSNLRQGKVSYKLNRHRTIIKK